MDIFTGTNPYSSYNAQQSIMSGMPRFSNPNNGNAYQNSYMPNIQLPPQQQQIQQQQQQQQTQPSQPQGMTMFFVNGKAGAKAFSVAPNSKVVLFDSDADCFYVKSSDANGMAKMIPYKFKEVKNNGSKKVKKAKKDKKLEETETNEVKEENKENNKAKDKPVKKFAPLEIVQDLGHHFTNEIEVLKDEIKELKSNNTTKDVEQNSKIPPKKKQSESEDK